MQTYSESGTLVRAVSSGRSLEKAAFDFNAGDPYDEQGRINHLHVYPSLILGIAFICSSRELTREELIKEVPEAIAAAKESNDHAAEELLSTLLSPEGDELIATRQNGNRDTQIASRDIVKVLFPDLPYRSNEGTWRMVKDEVTRRRNEARG